MGTELSQMRVERELAELRSLIEDLENEDWQLRLRSLKSLATVRRTQEFIDEAIPLIVSATQDDNTLVRQAAIPLLGEVGGAKKGIVETLTTILTEGENSEVKSAAYALGKIGPDSISSIMVLLHVLQKENVEIQKAIAWSLSMLGPEAVPVLTKELSSGNVYLRMYTASALGSMGPIAISSLPKLLENLKDEDPRVRLESAKALGNLRAASEIGQSIGDLQNALSDPDPDVRWVCAEALRKIGTDEAMEAWASYEEIPSCDAYLQQLSNEDKAVRLHAAEQLYPILEKNSVVDFKILGKALMDTYYKIPIALCEAIAKLEDNALPLASNLEELLSHETSSVRASAVTCLGKINSSESDEAIIPLLEDTEKEVRLAAGLALELLETPKGKKALKKFKWE